MPIYTFHCVNRDGSRPTFQIEELASDERARNFAERLFREWRRCDVIEVETEGRTFTVQRKIAQDPTPAFD